MVFNDEANEVITFTRYNVMIGNENDEEKIINDIKF
jgi:hypothetical protein